MWERPSTTERAPVPARALRGFGRRSGGRVEQFAEAPVYPPHVARLQVEQAEVPADVLHHAELAARDELLLGGAAAHREEHGLVYGHEKVFAVMRPRAAARSPSVLRGEVERPLPIWFATTYEVLLRVERVLRADVGVREDLMRHRVPGGDQDLVVPGVVQLPERRAGELAASERRTLFEREIVQVERLRGSDATVAARDAWHVSLPRRNPGAAGDRRNR